MNSVGIDVSKGKSMIAVMRPFGEVVCSPFEVSHTSSELSALAKRLKSLDGETRVVMEATGNYHLPIAMVLHEAGIYVSVVNAMLVHDYGKNACDTYRLRVSHICLNAVFPSKYQGHIPGAYPQHIFTDLICLP